jgi:hypothetical protein
MDGIAIPDLLKEIDVFITGWSSTALEALDQGIPTLSYDSNLLGFPSDLVLSGTSRLEYLNNLDKCRTLERSETLKTKADNWLIHIMVRGSEKVGGRIFEKLRSEGPSWIARAFTFVDLYMFPITRDIEFRLAEKNRLRPPNRINDIVLHGRKSLFDSNLSPNHPSTNRYFFKNENRRGRKNA